MSDLLKAIANLEGRLRVTSDNMKHHEGRVAFHKEKLLALSGEATGYATAIRALKEIIPEIVAPKAEAVPEAPVEPFPEDTASILQVNGTGKKVPFLDRTELKRLLHTNRVRYPLAVAHRKPSQLAKQFMIAAAMRHPDYIDAVSNGAPDLTDIYGRSQKDVDSVLDLLGIDRNRIVEHAKHVHEIIYTHGVEGTDYL